jgi:cyclase
MTPTAQARRPWPRLIPCLDVRDGRVVKGIRFGALRDVGDPVDLARQYAVAGADEIVILDIAATLAGRQTQCRLIEAIRRDVDVPVTVGGGVKSLGDAQALFAAGADKVAINSAAVTRPRLISEIADQYGTQAVVVAIDAWRASGDGRAPDYQIRVRGGTVPLRYGAPQWGAMAVEFGAGELLLTSWDQDGGGGGYDLGLIAAMRQAVDAPIIASGGARTPSDLAAAWRAGADAMLVASMLHDRRFEIGDLKQTLTSDFGCEMRPVGAPC